MIVGFEILLHLYYRFGREGWQGEGGRTTLRIHTRISENWRTWRKLGTLHLLAHNFVQPAMETIYELSSFVLGDLILLYKIHQAILDANCILCLSFQTVFHGLSKKNFGVVFFPVHGLVVNVLSCERTLMDNISFLIKRLSLTLKTG
jgi:hypothetical protein